MGVVNFTWNSGRTGGQSGKGAYDLAGAVAGPQTEFSLESGIFYLLLKYAPLMKKVPTVMPAGGGGRGDPFRCHKS